MKENPTIEELIFQCRNGTPQERCSAIVKLQEIGERNAVSVFLELIDFPDPGVRANVACALGDLGQKEDVGVDLIKLLKDPDSLVRINASNSLGLLQYREGIDTLINILQIDKDSLVRLHAAEALGMIGGETAVAALIKALDDVDESVRAYAADAIGNIRWGGTSSILAQKLKSEQSPFTKAFFLSALYRLGDEKSLFSLFELAEIADDSLAVTVLNLAAKLVNPKNKEALKYLMSKFTQSRPRLRLEIESLIKSLDSGESKNQMLDMY